MSSNVPSDEKRTDSEQSTNTNSPENGVSWFDLTAFQRDCLRFLAEMEAEGAKMYGMGLKDRLSAHYGEINHGRLYPNLDELADEGLIEIGEIDRRTNSYKLSDAGRRILREQQDAWNDLVLVQVPVADGGESA